MLTAATLYLLGTSNPQLERSEVILMSGERLTVCRGSSFASSISDVSGTFPWSRAVQAVTVLLLRLVVHRLDSSISPCIKGEQGSLAASLDSALSKETRWICEMFGFDSHGRAVARKITTRSNPERKRPGPVTISFKPQVINETEIKIFLNGTLIDASMCGEVLRSLEGHSSLSEERSRLKVARPSSANADSRKNFQVALFSPSDGANPFYSHIVRTVAQKFPGQLIPILPKENFDPHHMWLHADRYLKEDRGSSGIILIPDEPELHRDTILKLYRRPNITLVLFDVDIGRNDDRSELPPFVGGDEEFGGFLAAELATEYFKKQGISRPKVLIVRGATTDWELKRSGSFSNFLRAAFPGTDITESPKLHYDRAQSRRYLLDHLTFQSNPQPQYDLIFACNDDMALGCRTALLELKRQGPLKQIETKIIGYDGMREVQELIRFEDEIILGTIDVQLDSQLELLCNILKHEIVNRGSYQSRYLVKPRVVKGSVSRLNAVGE